MEAIADTLRKHPISIIFYLLYGWAVISEYLSTREFEWKIAHGQTTHMREWGGVLPFLMGFIFIIVTMANILAKKDQMKFYICLLILIIIPLIVLDNMN
jgi:predicted permease